MKVNIKETLTTLLIQEDTDGDKKITIEDNGKKHFIISSETEKLEIKGTYALSNLLQELVLAEKSGREFLEIDQSKIFEKPSNRISRMIREYYWKGLTRRMDSQGIQQLIADTKNNNLKSSNTLRIYVPYKDELAKQYYTQLKSDFQLDIIILPEQITAEYVKSINKKTGILSLKLQKVENQIIASPFVVPGGRFNEMYGWDSYFQNIGLIVDKKIELAKSVVDNMQYEIEYYGKILNANRTYYLTRTQPPFYTSMISEVFEVIKDEKWLKSHLKTALLEYHSVWMVKGNRFANNELNRYCAEGIGITPESEENHYDSILKPYAEQKGIPIQTLREQYIAGSISIPELDDYFLHDRSVRESGHDTTYRFEGICANINPVELNCMLYKYELDFAKLIKNVFDDNFEGYTSDYWKNCANKRKEQINKLMWNEEDGIYYDYDFTQKRQHRFLAASCFFPLWVGIPDKMQADRMINEVLPKLIEKGGIAGSSKQARGKINAERPERQWDYPNGWAPHQMIIWKGLKHYGYDDLAEDLIFRWLKMITRNAMDYNGTIPEKFDVVNATHKVFAEYGNVGTDFEYITQEGFGWMNASYQYGLSLLSKDKIDKLDGLA